MILQTAAKRFMSKTLNSALNVTKFGIGAFIFFEYVGGFVVCLGPSMEPTIVTRDILITEHISHRLGLLSKGDIVIARCPVHRRRICKRVVGVPGDQLNDHGNVITVPKDHVWLEGDNKFNSMDSRIFGPVPMNSIRGRCISKIYPSVDLNFNDINPYTNKSSA